MKPGKRIFISGPMSGYPDYNRAAFARAARQLKRAGYTPINPGNLRLGPEAEWQDYMLESLKLLNTSEGVALLPKWQLSDGAQIEKLWATRIGLITLPVSYWLDVAQVAAHTPDSEVWFADWLRVAREAEA